MKAMFYKGLILLAILVISCTGLYAQKGKGKGHKESKVELQDTTSTPEGGKEMKHQANKEEKDKAQQNREFDKEAKAKAFEKKNEGNEEVEETNEGEEDMDNQVKGKGNAYGKNKGDLEGKEFGQARAEQAKINRQAKENELKEKISTGDQKLLEAKEKVKAKREELEKDKRDNKITEEEYELRKKKIDETEAAVNELEGKLEKGKEIKKEEM